MSKRLLVMLMLTLFMFLGGIGAFAATDGDWGFDIVNISGTEYASINNYTGSEEVVTIPSTLEDSGITYDVVMVQNVTFANPITGLIVPNENIELGAALLATMDVKTLELRGNYTTYLDVVTLWDTTDPTFEIPLEELIFPDATFVVDPSNDTFTLPDGLFDGLVNLKKVLMPEALINNFPVGLFDYNPLIEDINFSSAVVTSLPDGFLKGKLNLKTLNINVNSVVTWGDSIFEGSKVPAGATGWLSGGDVVTVGNNVFKDAVFTNDENAKVIINLGINGTIGDSTFEGATGLKEVRYSGNFTSIGADQIKDVSLDVLSISGNILAVTDKSFNTTGTIGTLTYSAASVGSVEMFKGMTIGVATLTGSMTSNSERMFEDVIFTNDVNYALAGVGINKEVFKGAIFNGNLNVGEDTFGEGALDNATITNKLVINYPLVLTNDLMETGKGHPIAYRNFNVSIIEFEQDVTLGHSASFSGLTGVTGIEFKGKLNVDSAYVYVTGGNFNGLTTLSDLYFRDEAQIPEGAFNDLSGLTVLDLANVVSVGDNALLNLSGVNGHLSIPATLLTIGNGAFANAAYLGLIFEGDTTVGITAFTGSSVNKVVGVGGGSVEALAAALGADFDPYVGSLTVKHINQADGTIFDTVVVKDIPLWVQYDYVQPDLVGWVLQGSNNYSFTPALGDLDSEISFNFVVKKGLITVNYLLQDDMSPLLPQDSFGGLDLDDEVVMDAPDILGYAPVTPGDSFDFTPDEAVWEYVHTFLYTHAGTLTVKHVKESDGTVLDTEVFKNLPLDLEKIVTSKTITGYKVRGLATRAFTPTLMDKFETIEFRYEPVKTTSSSDSSSSESKEVVTDGGSGSSSEPSQVEDIFINLNDSYFKIGSTLKRMDVKPQVVEGRTMLPIRFIAEAFGYKVSWEDLTQKVTIEKGNKDARDKEEAAKYKKLELVIGKKTYGLDVAPYIAYGRTMVPLRYIGESMGSQVHYDDITHSVVITQFNDIDVKK